jgi:hypothetical protein
MKYIVVTENSILKLETEINSYIKRGWIPQGGVAILDNNFYVQAMIKTNKNYKNPTI